MTRTWFTADTHFGHANIIKHSKRPFASIEEMDATIILNWNATVGPKDDVWHLGDFSYRAEHSVEWYLQHLHGRIHIVWGNHDKEARRHAALFASVQEVKYLKLNDEKITLYHYAQRVWRNSHHGAWHLYGHSHGCLPGFHRSMDVGVDCNSFKPVGFDEVADYMATQDFTHHHPELITDPWDKS